MSFLRLAPIVLAGASALAAQTPHVSHPGVLLSNQTALPIIFTKTVSAAHATPGDIVLAKTTQSIRLSDGGEIRSGSVIAGHVLSANAFRYDEAPYAKQKDSVLSIRFDSVEVDHQSIPLNVTVRAIADPITSEGARTPINHDIDPSGATTQIGGDQRYPWNAPVTNEDGDAVAYSRHGGVYAHLIASGHCDASSIEVSVGIYSASACGLYGFPRTTAEEMGTSEHPSVLTLSSTHGSPEIWKGSTALLEVVTPQVAVASR